MADTAPPPPPPPAGDAPPPPPPGSEPKKAIWKRWWFIAIVVVVIIGAIGAAGGGDDEEGDTAAGDTSSSVPEEDADDPAVSDDRPDEPDDEPEPEPEEEPEPDLSEADDIESCTFIDSETLDIAGTNNSSKQSSYFVEVVFTGGGTRTGDETFFVNYIRPGERFVERAFVFEGDGADACEVASVERVSDESPNDVSEVTCEITGEDVLGDIAGTLTATNGSSESSDYSISVSLVRDGVRIGVGNALTENVRPGESAPTDLFTTVDGPADGVTCDVVHVQRTAA